MTKLRLKKIVLTIAVFWSLGILSSLGQTFSAGAAPGSGVLISQTPSNPGQNMEVTLVDIKAVDAPTVHTQGNKTGIGSEERYGQGIIIDSSGIIATNIHIIRHAEHVYVLLAGGQMVEASVLRKSLPDLCLIKINVTYPLRAVALADSSEIQIGSNVIAVTNAGFNLQRMRGGQIIKVFKEETSNSTAMIEMNIPLKPGDSGGPILNQEGSLLGLIVGKQISDPGKSYAIASSLIQQEYFKYRNSILN